MLLIFFSRFKFRQLLRAAAFRSSRQATHRFANQIGREACAEKIVIYGGSLARVQRPTNQLQLAGKTLLQQIFFACFREGFLKRGFDVPVRNSTGAQFAGDAETALLSLRGARAGEVAGVAGVIEQLPLFQASKHRRDEFGVFCLALK